MRTWEARDPDLGRPIAATASRSGVSCSLSGNYAPRRSAGAGAATSTVDALQQAAIRAMYTGKLGARSVTDTRRGGRSGERGAGCESHSIGRFRQEDDNGRM